ncbi:MAG: efflux RND transporter permease subunit [Treponema sp.]|nr:efflux RND transporter permease subunit [Treponema sp.]
MRRLIELCARRPVTVIMSLAALLLAGLYSLSVLPVQRLPDYSFPRVTVETRYPGMGAEDIRSIVTVPIEDALSSVKGLRRIRSVSRDDASLVVLDFAWGAESGTASVLVREAIDAVYPGLPEGVQKPAIIPGDPEEEPQIVVEVSSPHGESFARNLAEYEIRSRLRRVSGTSAIVLLGGELPELEVQADLPRAVSRGFSPADIAALIASETSSIPAGNAREGDMELVVVSSGRPESVEELAGLVLPSSKGPLVLEDLGKVFTGTARKKSLFISPERNGAALEVYRRPGADPLKLSRDVVKAIDEAAAVFGRDADITVVWDEAPSITGGIRNLFLSACFGSAAVAGVLFYSLRRFRYSLLAGFSIPLSASASLSVLAISGASLNGMSLSGIALGIGLVSDTAVIILDLLHKSFGREEAPPDFDRLSRAAASVAASSLGGTVTTALVFLPVLFLPGPLGSLFGDLSLSLLVSVGTGWAYAQFALPCLYRLSFKAAPKSFPAKNLTAKAEQFHRCQNGGLFPRRPRRRKQPAARGCYAALLKKVLRKPIPALILAAALSVFGLVLLSRRPAAFVSSGGIQELRFTLDFPAGTILESMESEAEAAARSIAGIPGIAAVFGRAGAEDEDTGKRADPGYRKERAILRCMLVPGFDADKALAELNALAGSLKTGEAARGVSFPPDKTEKLLGLSSDAAFALRAKDREELERRLAAAEKTITGSGLVSKFSVRPREKRPEIRILPDRAASAFLGLSQAEAARSVYASLEGVAAGELEIGGRPLEMKVSGDPAGLSLEKLPVAVTENGPVFLGSIGNMERREVPSALLRLDRSDAVYLDVFPEQGREKKLASFLTVLCGNGGQEGFSRADDSVFVQYKTSLVLTTLLVLIILYLSMAALFESFLLPLILMLTIPFSLAGAGPVLLLSGASVDSSSVLGLMVLFGLAVNSGMVLFERALEKTGRGLSPGTAVYGAAMDRRVPILATTLTTALALVPMVSSLGGGQRSMAAAMLGGVSASTLLSLFALPPVFIRYLRRKRHG